MSDYIAKQGTTALGIIGTALGGLATIGGGMNLIGNTNNAQNNYITKDVFDVQLQLIDAQKQNAILAADLSSEKKMVEVFNAANEKINAVRDELNGEIRELERKVDANAAAQSVYNATNSSTVGIINAQVQQLMSLCSLKVSADNICPKPMPLYNSWKEPVA